jgi:hypothetical protein
MALPASGSISLSAVNTELALSSTAQITMNDAAVRSLFGKSSGAIAMSDGYGKSSIAPFVAVGWENPFYSTNGTTWSSGTWPSGLAYSNPSQPYQWQTAIFGNGKYVASTAGSYPNTKVAYTTDGINWTASGTMPINASYTCGAYGGGVYVFLSNQGGANMITSTDAVNWTSRTLSGVSWDFMKYANGLFIATGGNSQTIGKSTDGTSWSTATYSKVRSKAEYGNGMWIQLGPAVNASPNWGKAYYYTSTDNAANWTERIGPYQADRLGYESPAGFNGVIYGGGTWVMFSDAYSSAYSTDGINWTTFMLPANGGWSRGTYSNGLFVIVGNSTNRVVTSPDGITWTTRSVPSITHSVYSVVGSS